MTKSNKNVKDIAGSDLLPEGITIEMLNEFWNVAENEYASPRKRMFLLDGADRSQLWKTITAKFPKYQVLPETNHINYLKENLLASIYVVGKSAQLLPKSQEDVTVVNSINKVLETLWKQLGVNTYQRKAGERAALFNIGVTQVGWKNSVIGGTSNFFYKGDVVLKNIDPQKFMRDPYADCADNGQYEITWDDYHISKIRSTKAYKERLTELEKVLGKNLGSDTSALSFEDTTDRAKNDRASKDYHRVISYWVRKDDGKLCEVHLLNNKYVLYVNNEIFSETFPFSILYCNEPGNDILGVSEPAKAFSNYIAYNMLNSIIATHAYKAQRPPRFVNMQSGINVRQFAKYGADADKTFLVNGDASEAVHYGKFPDLPNSMETLPSKLDFDIKDKSGIDDMYAGKDFGSVTTTGGTDNVISRTTGRDLVKIQLYEEYTMRLTQLIVQFYIKYGDKRVFAVKDKTSNLVTNEAVDFVNIPNDISFNYELNIQTDLPKNKMRLAQASNLLLEKQAQYAPNPEIITVEEWLMMQDIPFKDLIFDRIGIQRNNNLTEQVTQTLFQFAGLIEQGVEPDQALQMVTEALQQGQKPGSSMQGAAQTGGVNAGQAPIGNTSAAGSVQARQE